MRSLYLSIFILVISIFFHAIASPRLGWESKPYSPSNYEILQFRLWAPLLKVVLIVIVKYIKLQNIVKLYYMYTWSFYIIKRIYCLYVSSSNSKYADNTKPIFLFLESFLWRKVWLVSVVLVNY